jgi:hypothetical protein
MSGIYHDITSPKSVSLKFSSLEYRNENKHVNSVAYSQMSYFSHAQFEDIPTFTTTLTDSHCHVLHTHGIHIVVFIIYALDFDHNVLLKHLHNVRDALFMNTL